MKPLLRSAQAEEELAALRAELRGLRGALATAEAKRQELEETQVSVTQEKNDLALQLQAVSGTGTQVANETLEPDYGQGSPAALWALRPSVLSSYLTSAQPSLHPCRPSSICPKAKTAGEPHLFDFPETITLLPRRI